MPALELGAQIRTRTEFRDGFGNLPPRDADPAFFISQRSRLNAGLKGDRYRIFVSLQDARVWGQDLSTINRNTAVDNNGIMFHQAWGEILLFDTTTTFNSFKIRIGRQELVYDDERLLGGLDWLQQGRRHDAILFRLDHKLSKLDVGLAFNQNKEALSNTLFNSTPSANKGYPVAYPLGTNALVNNYKSLQFLHASRNLGKHTLSFLFLKDDFQRFQKDSVVMYDKGVWSRITTGLYSVYNFSEKSSLTGSVYYQGGKSPIGQNLSALLASLYSNLKLGDCLFIGPGIDYTSGNNVNNLSGTNYAFDPLYGTPHKFWGHLDYFYVANPMLPSGLVDGYFKVSYVKNKFKSSVNVHEFFIPTKLSVNGNKQSSRLGTEVDFDFLYNLTPSVAFIGGYACILGTNTLKVIKSVPAADKFGQFAYLMVNIKAFK